MLKTNVLLKQEPSVHQMSLFPEPFEMIKAGKKTIELRLWDEKRQKLKIGDTILFTNTANGEILKTTVLHLHRFSSFKDLYRTLPLLKCGYTRGHHPYGRRLGYGTLLFLRRAGKIWRCGN